jgi:hypothetical protein
MGKSTKRCGFSWSSGLGAGPSFSVVLCFDGFSDVFLASLTVLLVQNLSQLSPLLRMKLVISRKAWYDTGMFWYEGGIVLMMVNYEGGGVVILWSGVLVGRRVR